MCTIAKNRMISIKNKYPSRFEIIVSKNHMHAYDSY